MIVRFVLGNRVVRPSRALYVSALLLMLPLERVLGPYCRRLGLLRLYLVPIGAHVLRHERVTASRDAGISEPAR